MIVDEVVLIATDPRSIILRTFSVSPLRPSRYSLEISHYSKNIWILACLPVKSNLPLANFSRKKMDMEKQLVALDTPVLQANVHAISSYYIIIFPTLVTSFK